MRIITIFGLEPESYPGQYAPCLLAATDEYSDDDNPEYMEKEMKKAQRLVNKGSFAFVKQVSYSRLKAGACKLRICSKTD